MMERSSRFISLSGLSGVAAGVCALVGAWFAENAIKNNNAELSDSSSITGQHDSADVTNWLHNQLVIIAMLTFVSAFILSFLFTYLRSKKTNTPVWGATARRLMINVMIPMCAGGLYLLSIIQHKMYDLVIPGCLIFYGLALLNASKYTLTEIKFLAYGQILLGLINLLFTSYGIYFFAAGFGVLHIMYGAIMWLKYERT